MVYSENSKQDIFDWAESEKLRSPNTHRIHLGSSFGSVANANQVQGLDSKNFCLYVSTLEIRKNHLLLLKVWKKLIQEMGEQTPFLVFAGRRGWMIQETLDFIRNNPDISEKLVWLQNCSDNQLAWLYQNCFFSLYPSYYEGWGLPVVESLARGKLCLASNTSSIPEAGREFAEYFDPHSLESAYQTIKRFILAPELVHSKEREIASQYRQTKWSVTATDLFSLLNHVENRSEPRLILNQATQRL